MTNSDMAQSQGRAKIQIFSPFLWWLLLSRSPGTSLEVPTGVTSNWLWCQPLPSRLFHSRPSCALLTTDNLTFGSSHLDSATVLPHEDPLPQSQSRRLLCYTTIFQHPVVKFCGVIVVLEFVLFSQTVGSLYACSGETNLQTSCSIICFKRRNTNWTWHEVICSWSNQNLWCVVMFHLNINWSNSRESKPLS